MEGKYANPPIHEVIFEIQFILNNMDPTIFGRFYDKVEDKYPNRKKRHGIDIKLKSEKEELKNEVELIEYVQFFNKDNSLSISMRAPDVLTINCLRYTSWEEFREEIQYVLNNYKEVAEIKSVKRVLLRYINKINLDVPLDKLSDYFYYCPSVPKKYSKNSESFQMKLGVPYNDDRLILILATIPYEKNTIFYDIGYVLATPEKVATDEIQMWLENAHQKIKDAFEEGITNKCKRLFGEGNE